MRALDPTLVAHLQARKGIRAQLGVWIVARDRTTGVPAPGGYSTGIEDLTATIEGASRTYLGAGGLLGIEAVSAEAGLAIQNLRLSLSEIAPEVADILRGLDPRLAPVEVHRFHFDPETGAMVGMPVRLFRGTVDRVTITDAGIGGSAAAELVAVDAARALTRTLALKYSDEAQKLRGGDRGLRYSDVRGARVWWGQLSSTQEEAVRPKPTPRDPDRPTGGSR